MSIILLPHGHFHIIDEPELREAWIQDAPVDYLPRGEDQSRWVDFYVRPEDIAIAARWFEGRGFFIEKARFSPLVEAPARGGEVLYQHEDGKDYPARVESHMVQDAVPPDWKKRVPGSPMSKNPNLVVHGEMRQHVRNVSAQTPGIDRMPGTYALVGS
jgi:hypothetical protein